MKVVINTCHGGFSLSKEALDLYVKEKGIDPGAWNGKFKYYENLSYRGTIPRHDPVLVRIVEELGDEANGVYAELKVVDIPDEVQYTIQEYDGSEWIAEVHRTWS